MILVIILYIFFLLFSLFFILMFIYTLFSIFVDLKGAPFVPTSNKYISKILKRSNLKPDQFFVELGSGDGRIVRSAVSLYSVRGVGVDIHPLLIYYSRLLSKLQKLEKVHFVRGDLFKFNLCKADVIFMFLRPVTLKKLTSKLLNECKNNALIISHGYKIEELNNCLLEEIHSEAFPTYFYKIKK